MKCLRRNLRWITYYPYTGEETDLNENGEHTGEFYPEYGDPNDYLGNISTPSGQTNQTFYGEDIRYTHTLLLDNPYYDIREGGLIRWNEQWFDIIAVRPSLNVLNIALRRRTEDNIPNVPDEPDEPEEPIEGETGETGEPGGDEPGGDEPIEGETGETGEPGEEPVEYPVEYPVEEPVEEPIEGETGETE